MTGVMFLKMPESEKMLFFPGFKNIGRRRKLNEMIQFGQLVRNIFLFRFHSHFNFGTHFDTKCSI